MHKLFFRHIGKSQVGRYKDRETYLAASLKITDILGKMVQERLTIFCLDTPGYICKKSSLNLSSLDES